MPDRTVAIDSPLIELSSKALANLSRPLIRKLAVAVAGFAGKSDPAEATVEDLLNYFPARYEDRSNLVQIGDLRDGMEAAVEIFVKTSGGFRVGRRSDRRTKLFIFEITGADEARRQRPIVVKWFVSGPQAERIVEYYKEKFGYGTRLVAFGKWEWDKRAGTYMLKVNKPEELEILRSPPGENDTAPVQLSSDKELLEDVGDPAFALVHAAREVPIYRKLGPFQTKRLREIIYTLLQDLDPETVTDNLPSDLLKRQKLISRSEALTQIHFPPEGASIAAYEMFRSSAHIRLIFEEFFSLSFAMQLIRGERQKEPKGTVIEITDETRTRLKEFLPFSLTGAQKKVIGEIFADLRSDAPMNRLIQGDVGSGKTIVAFLAMFAAMENGYQTAMMAPTEILAEQHFRNAERLFEGTGNRVALLKGSTKASEKRKINESLATGELNMLIGTHAVIQEGVQFKRLGLAVIDEQHRFGVLQRAQLRSMGLNPDVLVMTATPIPRSLAMTVYGDLDVSIIDEMPPGRTPVDTVVLGEDKRAGVYRGIEREVKLGRQVYVVYPLVEESAKMDLKAATIMYDDLRTRVFPQFNVGLLHGKMKAADKESIMRNFVDGTINILVSTTVIEVGVDVPNASLMVIEHAERFGLSQLHQLRGRVGRGAEKSFCVLLTDHKKTAVAKERLGIMEATSDGFKIAEKDLEIRGQGEILGTRQSGVQNFRVGNIVRDLDLLYAARKEAEAYLTKHRTSPETSKLVKAVRSDKRFRLAGVG